MAQDCYMTKRMCVVDSGNLFRFLTEDYEEGMVLLAYDEWDEDKKAWIRKAEVSMSTHMANHVSAQIREVSDFVEATQDTP